MSKRSETFIFKINGFNTGIVVNYVKFIDNYFTVTINKDTDKIDSDYEVTICKDENNTFKWHHLSFKQVVEIIPLILESVLGYKCEFNKFEVRRSK